MVINPAGSKAQDGTQLVRLGRGPQSSHPSSVVSFLALSIFHSLSVSIFSSASPSPAMDKETEARRMG